jgi:hypothetical protein
MPVDDEKIRSYVKSLLEETKSLTEKEVKAAIAKNFKMPLKEVGAGLIRDVRKGMGIDRPTALAFAKSLLKKDPLTEGRTIVEAIASKFGIRLGPPDVSRLRPKSVKAARPRGRGAKKAAVAKVAAPAPERRPRRKAGAKAPLKVSGSAVSRAAKGPAGGTISLTFEGSGHPADLAEFFLSLGREA